MTQAPIHPRHKDQAAKAAGYEQPELVIRSIENGHSPVANETAASILAHAQTLANLEAARADLAEIDRIAGENDWPIAYASDLREAAAIAAPYRASDPVVEAIREMALRDATQDDAERLHKALDKRGLEIVERRDR